MAFAAVLGGEELASATLLLAEAGGIGGFADESAGRYALTGEILFLPEQAKVRGAIGLTLVADDNVVLTGIDARLCRACGAEFALFGEEFLAIDAECGLARAFEGKNQPLAFGDLEFSGPGRFEGAGRQKGGRGFAGLQPKRGQAVDAGIGFSLRLELADELSLQAATGGEGEEDPFHEREACVRKNAGKCHVCFDLCACYV